MKKFIFVVLVLALVLFLPLVAAVKTDITVKTDPKYYVNIKVDNPSTGEKVDHYFTKPDATGVVFFSVSTVIETIDVEIIVSDVSNVIVKQFQEGNHPAGEAINLDFTVKEGSENLTDTAAEENSTSENGNESEAASEAVAEEAVADEEVSDENVSPETGEGTTTGSIVSGGVDVLKKVPKWGYYVVGGVLVAFLVVFFVMKSGFSFKSHHEPKGGEEFRIVGRNNPNLAEEIERAEKKIKEAQEEIEKFKRKEEMEDRIKSAEKRLEEDKKELEKLREQKSG